MKKEIKKSLELDETIIISLIAKRANKLYPNISVLEFMMYVECMHKQSELALNDLLCSENVNFMHDISGIVNNTNTETNTVDNLFKPYYTKNHKIKQKVYLAKMKYDNGSTAWLEVYLFYNANQGEEYISFIRKDGVHAWHCNSLPCSYYRILEIKEKQ